MFAKKTNGSFPVPICFCVQFIIPMNSCLLMFGYVQECEIPKNSAKFVKLLGKIYGFGSCPLSQVGAPLGSRNSHGELPSEMCLDEATHMAFSSYQEHLFSSSRSPWSFQVDRPDAEDAEDSWTHHGPS